MKVRRPIPRTRCLLAGALAWPLLVGVASADPAGPGNDGPGPRSGMCDHGFRGDVPRHQGPSGMPGVPPPGFDEGRPPPFLMGLKLTDEQQDKIFSIVHNAAPALRGQSKAAHKARQALQEMTRSAPFNDGTAASLAQAQGNAEGQLELSRSRMEAAVYAVLTADQQAQVATREHEWESHRDSGPPPWP